MTNYHLVPTYLERLNNVKDIINIKKVTLMINVGCGKGDYDHELRDNAKLIIGVDINANDINIARRLHYDAEYHQPPRVLHVIGNATRLSLPKSEADLVISIDMLEHVKDQYKVIAEISRLLAPGGELIISFPTPNFPWTYDPINAFLRMFDTHLPIGAYAFGHTKLPNPTYIKELLQLQGLAIVKKRYLSHHFTGLVEMYWIGIMQSLIKENSKNTKEWTHGRPNDKKPFLTYDYTHPWWTPISSLINKIDVNINKLIKSKKSIGIMYHCVKIKVQDR